MQYFRNFELANLVNVSQSAVGKWIEAAKRGRLTLTLIERDGKSYIANTAENMALIEEMVQERKKFFNTRSHKVVRPSADFYKLYSESQIFDIMTSLDIYREIPLQYIYFGQGARLWDEYMYRLSTEETPNFLNITPRLLELNRAYVDTLIAGHKRVNLIDVGVGNATSVRELLAHLLDKKVLGDYIAIDLSPEMLKVARTNIKKWFGDRVNFEGVVRDVNHERITDVLAREALAKNESHSINLVLVFGGTLLNLRSPNDALKTIHDSMGRNDLLLYDLKLDTETSRRFFDFSIKEPKFDRLSPLDQFGLDLLKINESFYSVEMGFDEIERARFIRIRLKVALSIEFEFKEGTSRVNLNKGETILLWRYWHQSPQEVIDQFNTVGFNFLQASKTEEQDYMMVVARIKSALGLGS